MVRIALIICIRNRRYETERSMSSDLASGKQKLTVVDSLSTMAQSRLPGILQMGL